MNDKPLELLFVAGARPNFIKLASLVAAADERDDVKRCIVHTGQHYDERLSKEIFRDLELPEPNVNLGVGSASHGRQLARILEGFEEVLREKSPDAVVVVGDVNSTVAASILASRAQIPLVHVEAGLRSKDRTMPEEINRVMTDSISDFLFVTEADGMENLRAEGVPEERCFLVGNTMVDTLLRHVEKAKRRDICQRLGLGGLGASDELAKSGGLGASDELAKSGGLGDFGVVTLHRPATVDDEQRLKAVLDALLEVAKELPLVFPMHPRTKGRLEDFGFMKELESRIKTTEALSYLDFLCLQSRARLLLTDSGGIQEEAVVLEKPCLTIRENTERPCTVAAGSNRLLGCDGAGIVEAFRELMDAPPPIIERPAGWDGAAGRRIMEILLRELPLQGRR